MHKRTTLFNGWLGVACALGACGDRAVSPEMDSSTGALRGGWKTNHDTEDYSVGGGIRFKNEDGRGIRIDYAFRHFDGDFFDSVNIVSGGFTF